MNTIVTAVLYSSIFKAVAILVLGVLAIRIVMKLIRMTLEKSKLEKAAHSLITSLARVTMYTLLLLSTASALGIDVTGIVALASVLTLAVSLALQNMMANVIGGFTILSTQPFHRRLCGECRSVRYGSGNQHELHQAHHP